MKTVTVRAWASEAQPIKVELSEAEIVGLYRLTFGRAAHTGHRDLARFLLESIDHPLNGWLDTAASAHTESVLVPTVWLERLREALKEWVEEANV